MHTIDVPLFVDSIRTRVESLKEFQRTGLREINRDYDRGFFSACDHIIEELEKTRKDWE